ncbi:hypothetical protein U9256_23295 [Escherichia coli]
MRFTLPRFSLLQQLTAGCSDDIDEQHVDTFCSFFTVLKLIMGFADEVQQLVFTEASESPHLVAQLPDTEFLGTVANSRW